MRSYLLITLIVSAGLLDACKKSGNARMDTSLNITLHDCANSIFSNNQVRLCFDSVISDSRCPVNAICIWQGTAVCKFSFFTPGRAHTLVLSTLSLPGLYTKDTTVSGYKIEFINLMPYPGLPPVPAPGNEIKAEIKITKL